MKAILVLVGVIGVLLYTFDVHVYDLYECKEVPSTCFQVYERQH